MPKYEVTAPTGRKFEVEAPDIETAGREFDAFMQTPEYAATIPQYEDVRSPINRLIEQGGLGVTEGALQIVGLPGTLADAATRAGNYLYRKAAQSITGEELPSGQELEEQYGIPFRNPLRGQALVETAERITGEFPEPKTTPERYARTIGEFVPGAGAAGALRGGTTGRAASNLAKFAALPGAASEAAGQAFEGTSFEVPARILAALLVGGPFAVLDRPSTAAGTLRTAMPDVDAATLDAAERLMQQSRSAGTPITLPEAIQQVSGGEYGRLSSVQRVAEQTEGGAPIMDRFMAERSKGNIRRFDDVIDLVGSEARLPSELAPALKEAASTRLDQVRQTINAWTEPLYRQSRDTPIGASEFAQLTEDDIFSSALNQVRNNPRLNKTVKDLPDNSVGVLDAVKKQLDETVQNLQTPGTGQQSQTQAAAVTGTAADVRGVAQRADPQYRQALEEQARLRGERLEPMRRGMVGQLAATEAFPKQAGIILNPRPVRGEHRAVRRAIREINKVDPNAAKGVARARIAQIFDEATKDLTSGKAQFGAAKFRSKIAGNTEQRKVLEALIRETSGAEAWKGFKNMLDTFHAQGFRPAAGSMTTFNQQISDALAQGRPIPDTLFQTVGEPLRPLQRALSTYRDWVFRGNTEALANLITHPEAVQAFRLASRLSPKDPRRSQLFAAAVLNSTQPLRASPQPGQQIETPNAEAIR